MQQNQEASVAATFYLKTALINCANASKYLEMIIVEDKLICKAKAFIGRQVRKLNSVESETRQIVGTKFADTIRKEISENWETLGIQNVNHMMMAMDNNEILEVENFCAFIINRKKESLDNAEETQVPKEEKEPMDMGLIEG